MVVFANSNALPTIYFKNIFESLQRELFIECSSNNFGCFYGMCWSNCGPRLNESDWCFTTKTLSKTRNETEMAECMYDKDCDPCWSCATSCYMNAGNTVKIIEQHQTDRRIPFFSAVPVVPAF